LIKQGDIIRFDNGCLFVGDRRYENTSAVGPMLRTTRRLKEGEYFVMGDNEPDSFDIGVACHMRILLERYYKSR